MALHPETRKSWPVRLTAIVFILLILLGNYWILKELFGHTVPSWLFDVAGTLVASLFILIPTVAYLNNRESLGS